jgi:hypothetical protein
MAIVWTRYAGFWEEERFGFQILSYRFQVSWFKFRNRSRGC